MHIKCRASQRKQRDLPQDKNSFLHFCSCDSSLLFNASTGYSHLCSLWADLGVSLDGGQSFINQPGIPWLGTGKSSSVAVGTIGSTPSICGLCTPQCGPDQMGHNGGAPWDLIGSDQSGPLHPLRIFLSPFFRLREALERCVPSVFIKFLWFEE